MEQWHSERWKQAKLHSDKVKIFDEFIDLALDGVITLEQAIVGVYEILETEAEIGSGTL